MKRWRVMVELPALQDIEAAHLWLSERNPEAANRWLDRLTETIGSLEAFPERCPLAPESKFFRSEIREMFHGRRPYKYRILFTVAAETVHLLHVRHDARLAPGNVESTE